jgi:hypothetical protein
MAPFIKSAGLPVKEPSSDNSNSSNDSDNDFGGCPIVEEIPPDGPPTMTTSIHNSQAYVHFSVFLSYDFSVFWSYDSNQTYNLSHYFCKPSFPPKGRQDDHVFSQPGFPIRAGLSFVHSWDKHCEFMIVSLLYF